MNINELEKSFVRFQKALRTNSSFQPAFDDLDILEKLCKENNITYDQW